uniref:Uncharacterized protein n=1 Tax=Eptatretus burgeri TaxID=7764 RepID=A0A8C4NBI5_EPTBU
MNADSLSREEKLLKRLKTPPLQILLSQNPRNLQKSIPPCPNWTPSFLEKSDLKDRSLSPWTFKINHKKGRVPEAIIEAVCLCRGCINPSNGTEVHHSVSVPVYGSILVLHHRECPGGQVRYHQEHLRVAVGCTCAAPVQAF